MNGINSDREKIKIASHYDPFVYLGCHSINKNQDLHIRTFQPQATAVFLLVGGNRYEMKHTGNGFFEFSLPFDTLELPNDISPYQYQFELQYNTGEKQTINDPYGFLPLLSKDDLYLFNEGKNYNLHNLLGAHPSMFDSISGVVFRVWAPNAKAVSVIGDFNNWDYTNHQMRSLGSSGLWELFIPQLKNFELYKFSILDQSNNRIDKSDPFQFFGETRPQTSSKVFDLNKYKWNDASWQNRGFRQPHEQPISIYEVHLSSWRRDPNNPDTFLNYRDIADQLVNYVKEMGFTHIELLPVMEHPLDESWGYQVTAQFSITSRHGTPEDFMYFVDIFHQADIGVILDWVPAHFPKDSHSLGRFDGTPIYEHEDTRLGEHPEWGTYIYDYGRKEVSNYLISSALFWLEKYHIDGLRVDAVASMLYLDYSRDDGQWVANRFGGNHNLDAIEFIKHANSIIYQKHPKSLIIAEESTSFFGVSKPVDQGGLGFGFKWNMGWMNDILTYFQTDPLFRKHHHDSLTFSIMYAFSENFVLPLSHDEVVHGKRSLLDKMPGDEWQKRANLRLLLFYMWVHPGKKLLFMGGDIAQSKEWNCKTSLDWHLLSADEMSAHNEFVADLNKIYRDEPALWEADSDSSGFSWLNLDDRENSIIAFVRHAKDASNHLVCILNFTPNVLNNYKINLPSNVEYEEVFSSDSANYGGTGDHSNSNIISSVCKGNINTSLTIPPLAGVILKPKTTYLS